MLDAGQARIRHRRLLDTLQRDRLDALVAGAAPHVYYLSAHRAHWLQQSALVLRADGRSTLVCANEPPRNVAADETVTYEANPLGTQRPDQPAAVASAVVSALQAGGARSVGVDTSAVSSQVLLQFEGETSSVDDALWQQRRRKDPDELALMKTAIACCEAMYRRARDVIEPGIPEIRVFGELHAVAVRTAGEPLSDLLGNDYACGVPGGPARKDRPTAAGELYILDLGPAYRGYFSDNCRTISVDRRPTDAQLQAWETVTGVFPLIQRMARPGVRCRDVFAAVDGHYRSRTGAGFPHHLGHGVGLAPHELPRLNPRWDDTLQQGEVFTVEPGLYGPHLGGGMRLENQYLVTADGVRNLTPFPLGLV